MKEIESWCSHPGNTNCLNFDYVACGVDYQKVLEVCEYMSVRSKNIWRVRKELQTKTVIK